MKLVINPVFVFGIKNIEFSKFKAALIDYLFIYFLPLEDNKNKTYFLILVFWWYTC